MFCLSIIFRKGLYHSSMTDCAFDPGCIILRKRDVENYNWIQKDTLCTWMRPLHVTHIHKKSLYYMGRNKPAVHDSPVFHSHTNTHLLEISSPRTGIWSDGFFHTCSLPLWALMSIFLKQIVLLLSQSEVVLNRSCFTCKELGHCWSVSAQFFRAI